MMTPHERKFHGGGGPGGDVIRMTIITMAVIDKQEETKGAIRSKKN